MKQKGDKYVRMNLNSQAAKTARNQGVWLRRQETLGGSQGQR